MQHINSLHLIYIISFTDLFAIGLTYPLIGIQLRSLGATHSFIGLLGAIYSGLQVISGPIIGSWTDLKGRPLVLKKILLICGICYGLLGLTNSFFIIFILRIVLGCVKHIQNICKAAISDILPKEKHSEGFGRSTAISGIGFVLGPLIGGHISEFPDGFTYVCLLTMGLFLLNIIIVSQIKWNDTENAKKIENKPIKAGNLFNSVKFELTRSFINLNCIKWQEQWQPFFLRFLFGLTVSAYFSNQSLILSEKYHLSQKHLGYTLSFFNTIATISTFFLNYFNQFYNYKYMQKLCHLFSIMALSLLIIYISPNFYVFCIALMPFSIASSLLRVFSLELIITNTDVKHKGALSGASNSIMSVARFITPFLAGILADKFGEKHVLLISVIPALFGVLFTYCLNLSSTSNLYVD